MVSKMFRTVFSSLSNQNNQYQQQHVGATSRDSGHDATSTKSSGFSGHIDKASHAGISSHLDNRSSQQITKSNVENCGLFAKISESANSKEDANITKTSPQFQASQDNHDRRISYDNNVDELTTSKPKLENSEKTSKIWREPSKKQQVNKEAQVNGKTSELVGRIPELPAKDSPSCTRSAATTNVVDGGNPVGVYTKTSKLVFGKENVSSNKTNKKSGGKRRLVSFMDKIQKSIHSSHSGGANFNGVAATESNLTEQQDSNNNSNLSLENSAKDNITTGQSVPNKAYNSERRRSSIWNLKMVGHLTGHHKDHHHEKVSKSCDDHADGDDDDEEEKYSTHKNYSKSKFVLPEEECNIPTFLETKNCDPKLINETRRILRERFAKNPENFYEHDYQRMLTEDWTVSRFLLRRRCDPKRTAKLMEECGRFRRQYKMSEVKLWEFPVEFHKAGGLFKYARDRVGNVTVYMRVKMYRRVPEISDVFKAFILCVLEEADLENGGRGTAVIFDLSSCGLQNVDLSFLSWLLSSFRNYCPKGVSYILVYNLPWILSATCKLAMTWMSASNRRALRFVHGHEIEEFIAKENLPDYLGGSCPIDYRRVPDGAKPAVEVCDRLDMTQDQALKIRELFKEYIQD